mmetsp:Transcript_78215/g.108252  ORF Transcript_78215/g.108252 Transcript_78215/m.108252 type:complete len:115 (-) Transcript_78215:215-559(-)
MGGEIGNLISELFEERQNDFEELVLGHLFAIGFYAGCIISNQLNIGCTLIILHCFSEIFGCAAKLLSETIYKRLTVKVFISTMIAWFYSMLIMLPYCIKWIHYGFVIEDPELLS